MTIKFQILGQTFTALNGGPVIQFNESVSFVVRCQTQREVASDLLTPAREGG